MVLASAPTALAAPAVDFPTLVDIRAAHHAGFDRLVFEFKGGLPTSTSVTWVDRVTQDGSGRAVAVQGRPSSSSACTASLGTSRGAHGPDLWTPGACLRPAQRGARRERRGLRGRRLLRRGAHGTDAHPAHGAAAWSCALRRGHRRRLPHRAGGHRLRGDRCRGPGYPRPVRRARADDAERTGRRPGQRGPASPLGGADRGRAGRGSALRVVAHERLPRPEHLHPRCCSIDAHRRLPRRRSGCHRGRPGHGYPQAVPGGRLGQDATTAQGRPSSPPAQATRSPTAWRRRTERSASSELTE